MSCKGTITQLVSYGSESVYLFQDSEITLFKTVYKRHSNFSIDTVTQNFLRRPKFGRRVTARISKLGDLMYQTFLLIDLPAVEPIRSYEDSLAKLEILSIDLDNGQIINLTITESGLGYLYPPEIDIQSQTGIGAEIEAVIEFGIVCRVNVINPGMNYTTDDTVILSGGTPIHTFAWAPKIALSMLEEVEVDIGFRHVAKLDGTFLTIAGSLTTPEGKLDGYKKMIGDVPEVTTVRNNRDDPNIEERRLYVYLPFWFSRNIADALPLIALQYHTVEIHTKFRKVEEVIRRGARYFAKIESGNLTNLVLIGSKIIKDQTVAFLETENIEFGSLDFYFNYQDFDEKNRFKQGDVLTITQINNQEKEITILEGPFLIEEKVYPDPVLITSNFLVDYINLDRIERTLFARIPHEYVIEQFQIVKECLREPINLINLDKEHHVKEMLWVLITKENLQRSLWDKYETLIEADMTLNDLPRFQKLPGGFFNLVEPYYHHTRIPIEGINVYSFALYPENTQPSGGMNFGIIKDKMLRLSYPEFRSIGFLFLYLVNHNVLRIKSGVGGIMFYN